MIKKGSRKSGFSIEKLWKRIEGLIKTRVYELTSFCDMLMIGK